MVFQLGRALSVLCVLCVVVLLAVSVAEKPACVDSKRLCVYIQNVPVCTGNTPTYGRVGGRHGDVLKVHTEAFRIYTRRRGHRQFCLPKITRGELSLAPQVHQRIIHIFI